MRTTPSARRTRRPSDADVLFEVAASLEEPGPLPQVLDGFLATLERLFDVRWASVQLAGAHPPAVAGLGPDGAPVGCTGARVPIRSNERVLGTLELAFGDDAPEPGEARAMLEPIGRLLGRAIERARLEEEARRQVVLEERNLIGNELHDSLAQSFVGMRLQLAMLAEALARGDTPAAQYEAKSLQRALGNANDDLRELITNFRLQIGDSGLIPSLENLVARFGRETGIAVFFQDECRGYALTRAQETQVFFIVQESLSNIRRHSRAMNVRVMIANELDLYTVLIEDDGAGMTGRPEDPSASHAGLDIMRQRTERLPGQLVIESEPGEGTRIIVIFNAPPLGTAPVAA